GGGGGYLLVRHLGQGAAPQIIVRTITGGGHAAGRAVPTLLRQSRVGVVRVVRLPARGPVTVADVASGFVADPSGLVVTAAGAVEGAAGLEVVLASGRVLPATLAAMDPTTGLVVLRVADGATLPALPFGPPPTAGEAAIAVGAPTGAGLSIDVGIVSGTGLVLSVADPAGPAHRALIGGAVRVDTAVPAAAIGGPLLNGNGQVIGVLGATGLPGQPPGSTEALDATAAAVLVKALSTGNAVPVTPGVVSQTLDAGSAAALGLPAGALVRAVTPASPAARAGLRPGDVVTAVGDQALSTTLTLSDQLQQLTTGAPILLVLWRHGATHRVSLTLPVSG
ncbi:MAG TPA: S1C family serine protease, partial [Candidatus Dormibacteraeota bacterium]|nr:S1C family serine protease [Candidatus Dormibacteraeota bacterium]